MEKLSKLPKIYLIVVFIILYAPIFYLIFYSFNSGGSMSNFESFTLEHYAAVFEDTRLIVILINTIVVALLVCTRFDCNRCARCIVYCFHAQ